MQSTSRIKSIIAWAVILGAVAWFGRSQYERHQRDEERRVNEERESAEQVASLLALSAAHGARPNWPSELVQKNESRIAPLVSLELQEVWQRGSPITFVGILRDVIKNEDGTYQVQIQHDQFSSDHYFFATDLYFSARCSPELAAPILKLLRDPNRMAVFADAAVVGNVLQVSSAPVRSSEGADEVRITGTGSCFGTMSLTKILPSNWAAGKNEAVK